MTTADALVLVGLFGTLLIVTLAWGGAFSILVAVAIGLYVVLYLVRNGR